MPALEPSSPTISMARPRWKTAVTFTSITSLITRTSQRDRYRWPARSWRSPRKRPYGTVIVRSDGHVAGTADGFTVRHGSRRRPLTDLGRLPIGFLDTVDV